MFNKNFSFSIFSITHTFLVVLSSRTTFKFHCSFVVNKVLPTYFGTASRLYGSTALVLYCELYACTISLHLHTSTILALFCALYACTVLRYSFSTPLRLYNSTPLCLYDSGIVLWTIYRGNPLHLYSTMPLCLYTSIPLRLHTSIPDPRLYPSMPLHL